MSAELIRAGDKVPKGISRERREPLMEPLSESRSAFDASEGVGPSLAKDEDEDEEVRAGSRGTGGHLSDFLQPAVALQEFFVVFKKRPFLKG